MVTTDYSIMKTHFDRLISGHRRGIYISGLEPIRLTYLKAFGKQINMYDIHETPVKINTNPLIKSMISIIGPDSDDREIPEGIMMSDAGISHVSVFKSSDINRGISSEYSEDYIASVYYYMNTIIKSDTFYQSESISRDNPYMKFIRLVPFYMTYYHVNDCLPEYINSNIFYELLEKYLVNGKDNIEKLLLHLSERKYSTDLYTIYNTLTIGGELDNDILY